jgi:hypothetical protein
MNKFLEQTKKAASAARQASISNLNAASMALSNASGTNIKLTTAKTDEELMRLLKDEPILFSGPAWKRRGGLGKLASYSSAWEMRHLQLRGSVLLYFDSDPTKALSSSNDPQELLRGYLDFAEEKATVLATFGHSGAPSPFCLSIKVTVGLAQETKWKLCFDHHHTQMEWLAVMSDVVIQSSVDLYNRALLDVANQSIHGSHDSKLIQRPPVYEPGTKDLSSPNSKQRSKSFQLVECPHQLWMMDEYTLERKSTQSEEEKTKTKASVNTALQVMERLLSEERNQRVIASTRVKELEIQLEETREVKERTLNELQKLTKEKQLLEEELAIRICTHDLADLPQQTTEVIKLKARVETLSKELETKSNAFEQCREEKDAEIGGLEYKLSELQTQIVILNSKHDEELERVKHEVIQKESETGTVRREMQERIDLLHRDMEVSKQEYSDAIQALAANFQRSMGIVAASAED